MRNVRNWVLFTLALAGCLAGRTAFAGGEVTPSGRSEKMPVFPGTPVGQANSQHIHMSLHGECYSSNLRADSSPLAYDGCADIRFGLTTHPTELIDVLIPARYFDPMGIQVSNPACPNPALKVYRTPPGDAVGSVGPSQELPSNGWSLAMRRDPPNGGGIIADIQMAYAAPGGTILGDGSIKLDRLPALRTIYTRQTGIQRGGNGLFFGANGALTVRYDAITVSPNGTQMAVYFRVPGAAYVNQTHGVIRGFCGGFYSPLMLFFNDDRPRFTGAVAFNLYSGLANYHWPEPNSPGYFLAYDRNGNGTIDSGEELFGSDLHGKYPNGFERLRELDSNKDGVINANDKHFHDLTLWRDKNASGTTDKEDELIPLSKKGVLSISLKYIANDVRPVGQAAELRETAQFVYRDAKTDRLKKGEVIDVWLSPASRLPEGILSKAGK